MTDKQSSSQEEVIQVFVRDEGQTAYRRDALFPVRLAFTRVQELRKQNGVAWAYCEEPSVIPSSAPAPAIAGDGMAGAETSNQDQSQEAS